MTVVSCPPFLRWKCGNLIELINKYPWTEGDRHLNRCRAYPSGSERRIKARGKNERGRSCNQVKKHSSDYFTVTVKPSGDICCAEPVRGQKTKEYVVTDLDLSNDENRPSLTSNAVGEERQDASSKDTIDEIADAITGGNDVGLWALWPANMPEKCGKLVEIWNGFFLTLWWKVIFNILYRHMGPPTTPRHQAPLHLNPALTVCC